MSLNSQSLLTISNLSRPLKESDIVTPEEGRLVANQLNAPYYETSAYTGFGIDETFENVIRAALIGRRQQRFWMTNLRHVRDCHLQEPCCPPRPPRPMPRVAESQFRLELSSIGRRKEYTDVEFADNHGGSILCHKILLVAASDIFYALFTHQPYEDSSCHNNAQQPVGTSSRGYKRLSKCSSDMSIARSICDLESSERKCFNDDSLLEMRKQSLRHILGAYPILSLDTLRFLKHSFSKSNKLFSYTKLSDSKSKLRFIQEKLITFYRNVKNLRSSPSSKETRQSLVCFGKNIPLNVLEDYILIVYMLIVDELSQASLAHIATCLHYLDFVDFEPPSTLAELDANLKTYIGKHKISIFIKRLAFFGLEKGLFSGKLLFSILFCKYCLPTTLSL